MRTSDRVAREKNAQNTKKSFIVILVVERVFEKSQILSGKKLKKIKAIKKVTEKKQIVNNFAVHLTFMCYVEVWFRCVLNQRKIKFSLNRIEYNFFVGWLEKEQRINYNNSEPNAKVVYISRHRRQVAIHANICTVWHTGEKKIESEFRLYYIRRRLFFFTPFKIVISLKAE